MDFKVQLVDVEDLDIEEYSHFQQKCFQETMQEKGLDATHLDCSFFEWKYTSPYGKSKIALVRRDGKIIAANSLSPQILSSSHGITKAWQAGDSATASKSRSNGLSLKVLSRLHGSIPDSEIMFGFPNEKAIGTVKRAGFPITQTIPYWLGSFNLLNVITSPNRFDVRKVEHFGFSYQASQRGKSTTYFKKTHEYLNWRYLTHPKIQYSCWAVYDDDELSGYCVGRQFYVRKMKISIIMELHGNSLAHKLALLRACLRDLGNLFFLTISNTVTFNIALKSLMFKVPEPFVPKTQYLTATGRNNLTKSVVAGNWQIQTGDWDGL